MSGKHLRQGTFTRPTDISDDDFRKEREALALPFSKSPFVLGEEAQPEPVEELEPGEVRVRVADELPWSDLLLEVAMTTAFASLTDGTPIVLLRNALSYLCFFILVWWIWASQVCYNLRYRQADWLHRFWIFLQLIVFSSLAAFTHDFDITNGIAADKTESTVDQMLLDSGVNNQAGLVAKKFRDNRLPKLNSRGVSVTMAFSRLLLLVQYAIVVYHSRRSGTRRAALWTHVIALVVSILCYTAAYFILDDRNSTSDEAKNIVKICLWYLPIVIEAASHFIANTLPGHVRYSTEGIVRRSGTVFIIILGGGLDKITGGLKDLVGNTGMGASGSGLFLSAAVIFFVTFSLYFGSPRGSKVLSNQRALSWFFAHFFYVAPVIITLQGVATSLSYSNLGHAAGIQLGAVQNMVDHVLEQPDVNLTAADLSAAANVSFAKTGMSLDNFLDYLNVGIAEAKSQNDVTISYNSVLQANLLIISNLLFVFDALPDPESLLWAKMYNFLYTDPANFTAVNVAQYSDIYSEIVKSRGSAASWFYGAAGSTLLALVLLNLLKSFPRDKWEWGTIISRLIVGIGVSCLAFLSLGSSKPLVNPDGSLTNSKIWMIMDASWLLPIFAIAIGLLQIVEYILVHLAYHSYFNFGGLRNTQPPTMYQPVIQTQPLAVFPPYMSSPPAIEQSNRPLYYDPYYSTGVAGHPGLASFPGNSY